MNLLLRIAYRELRTQVGLWFGRAFVMDEADLDGLGEYIAEVFAVDELQHRVRVLPLPVEGDGEKAA